MGRGSGLQIIDALPIDKSMTASCCSSCLPSSQLKTELAATSPASLLKPLSFLGLYKPGLQVSFPFYFFSKGRVVGNRDVSDEYSFEH